MKRWILIVLIALAFDAVVVFLGFTQIKLDALQEPGHLETVLATHAKHTLVRQNSREGIPPAQRIGRQASKKETSYLEPRARRAMASMVTNSPMLVAGCTHVPRISPRPKCNSIPIAKSFGL